MVGGGGGVGGGGWRRWGGGVDKKVGKAGVVVRWGEFKEGGQVTGRVWRTGEVCAR